MDSDKTTLNCFREKKASVRIRGQITIFFAMSLILLVTVIAFVVNLGIFVKSKINLQNAVDAAAWSGAAVQSRQLTTISYLNWEMRNVYKEWMFKYYVLGMISHPNVNPGLDNNPGNLSGTSGSGNSDFSLKPFDNDDEFSARPDGWNLPSICINYNQTFNLCEVATLPGLPRHNTTGGVGVDETHNIFYNAIVKEKSRNCALRGIINYHTAQTWAYGTGSEVNDPALSDVLAPIAATRPGAWPSALELAMRIRNLEYVVNTPPQSSLCFGGQDGCIDIASLETGDNVPAKNERAIKAFWSAYRNLSNTDARGANTIKRTFKLTELAPQAYSFNQVSLSGLLIPGSASIAEKHYLDLKILPVNLTTFFTYFVTHTHQTEGKVPDHAACNSSRVALPVPGYPMGFMKNPEVLTYYAVKGEAEFIGLFNPFNDPIKLVAYSAAKPFGGRIGPQVFAPTEDDQGIIARINRTFPFLLGVNTGGGYNLGDPIPARSDFYLSNPGDVVGGFTSDDDVRFSVPNLIYDIPFNTDYQYGSGALEIVEDEVSGVTAGTVKAGLYEARQLEFLKESFRLGRESSGAPAGDLVTAEHAQHAIMYARRPTRFDALNYLIPTTNPQPGVQESKYGVEQNVSQHPLYVRANDGNNYPSYSLYAPISGDGTLYPNPSDIEIAIQNHIDRNLQALNKYLEGLYEVKQFIMSQDQDTARGLYARDENTPAGEVLLSASNQLHDGDTPTTGTSCLSMAGQFYKFFSGSSHRPDANLEATKCPITLKESLADYINKKLIDIPTYREYFTSTYVMDFTGSAAGAPSNSEIMSGYAPGPNHGANENGTVGHNFLTSIPPLDAHRNFYSTKFIPIQSVFSGGSNLVRGEDINYVESGVSTVYSEGNFSKPDDIIPNWDHKNALERSQLQEFLRAGATDAKGFSY